LPVAGAVLAVVLATVAAGFGSTGSGDFLTIVCYLAAIIIFAVTALPDTVQRKDGGTVTPFGFALGHPKRVLVPAGLVLAIMVNVVSYELVYRSLQNPQVSNVTGPVLWLISLLILVAVSALARSSHEPSPTWEAGRLPTAPLLRRLFLGAVAALIILAVAARLIGLAEVPHGINADEGDRTATAISILRGYDTSSIFSSGWFYISNVYFWLLAGVLKVLGIGYAQARAFGAVASIFTFCVTVWIGFRHFGARVAILTGVLGAVLAVSLQFARETTEATQTALLWTLSVAFFLEAARRGRPWLWVASGVTGALSIYFYPSGRLWAVLAAGMCGYMFLWTRGRRRWDIVAGTGLMAIAAAMTVSPFFANIALNPDQLSQRAQQTSIFSGDNPTRLAYYDPHWSTLRLLWAQVEQSLGIFSRVADGGGFWPTDRPIMWGLLSIVTYLGIGWVSFGWRDPRKLILALWFWVGFVGVIVTVETPNVQRMATAVPVLPILCALVLDNMVRRLGPLATRLPQQFRAPLLPVATALAVLVAGALAFQQWSFYFRDYAAMDRWPQPTIQGRAVADQGPNALVITVGRESHQINSGWVRLLAPDADRGGMPSPGSTLPLALPADRDLAFMLYPTQEYYLPYLEQLYPGGTVHRYKHPTEGLVVTIYRVPRLQWSARQGALASVNGGHAIRVSNLGALPARIEHFPVHITWSAQLRIPQFWNYDIEVSPDADRLNIDGLTVLHGATQRAPRLLRLSLARGEHYVRLDATITSTRQRVPVELKAEPEQGAPSPVASVTWQTTRAEETVPAQSRQGLFAEVHGAGVPDEQRLDGTLATCCLSNEVNSTGGPYEVVWRGSLTAPESGTYPMTMYSQGLVSLKIDGRSVIRSSQGADTVIRGRPHLKVGRHTIQIQYAVQGSPGGLEWTWTPPGKREQVVPASVLQPPPGAGVGPPAPAAALKGIHTEPADMPLDLVQ
jgi:hypothetical protein